MPEILAGDGGEEPPLLGVERRGAETVAVAGLGDRLRRPALDERQPGEQAPPGIDRQAAALPLDPPIERGAMAQHGIDMLGDGAAVLGAGEAMAAKIPADDVVRRRPSRLDRSQKPDRRLDPRAGGHSSCG